MEEYEEADKAPKVYPQSINFPLIGYTDRLIKSITNEIDNRCKLWQSELEKMFGELNALRREWQLEHANLIQRFESDKLARRLEKVEIDKHFDRVNELQARMDKLSSTFQTAEQVDNKIKIALGELSKYFAILVIIIISALSAIVYLLEKRA